MLFRSETMVLVHHQHLFIVEHGRKTQSRLVHRIGRDQQVLVVHKEHRLAGQNDVAPTDLLEETLITYPVPLERLDIYQLFLLPAGWAPRRHKTIETTDIMLQMVASGRGVTALPKWLVTDYAPQLQLKTLRLGPSGIQKHIYLGVREEEVDVDYLNAFITLARGG